MSIGITGLLVGTRNLPSTTQFFTIPSRRLVVVELMSLHVTIAFNVTRGFVRLSRSCSRLGIVSRPR
jgi:hypothetical protein